MKKCLAFILLLFVFASSKAIPLFPFFTDLAGDYKDGIPAEWAALKIKCMYSRTSPFFYSNMEGAEAFLKDVLPVSTEKIVRSETKLKDGTLIVKYESPLSDGGVSTLYLVEIPNKPFAVGYNETKKAQQTAQPASAGTSKKTVSNGQQSQNENTASPKKQWLKKLKKEILK